jgi:lipopolysaccharide transport system permease protein
VVWLIFFAVVNLSLQWTIIYLPLILFPLLMMTMGLSWFLASLGVYLRDAVQAVGIVTTMLMFVSPIFFPVASLPSEYRPLIYANPLTFIIEQSRAVLVWGQSPDWITLGIYTLASLVAAWLGFAWFQKTRRGFADVI